MSYCLELSTETVLGLRPHIGLHLEKENLSFQPARSNVSAGVPPSQQAFIDPSKQLLKMGLSDTGGDVLADARTGKNGRHRLCHGNGRGIEGRNGLIGSHAAATASDHCAAASALKIRRVDREIRWH